MALARGSSDYADLLCSRFTTRFSSSLLDFIDGDFSHALTPEVLAFFSTTDSNLTLDYRPMFVAARQLGIEKFVAIDADGPTVQIPDQLLKWRSNASMRVFVETCLLCKILPAQIAADMKTMWGVAVDEDDIKIFAYLFVDIEYTVGNSWFLYMKCIGDSEAQFKRRLMEEPIDFVRWKLGVPVAMDSERVLDRMISDAYYTERLIKHEAGEHGINLEKDKLTRIKMERQTIFSGLAMRVKLKEVTGGSGNDNDITAELRKFKLEYGEQSFPLKDELTGEPEPSGDSAGGMSLTDLQSENDKP